MLIGIASSTNIKRPLPKMLTAKGEKCSFNEFLILRLVLVALLVEF